MSFQKIEEKVDKIDERLGDINVHLERYNGLLKEHIRRTEILEEKLTPIEHHVVVVQAVTRWMLFGGGIGLLIALAKYLGSR